MKKRMCIMVLSDVFTKLEKKARKENVSKSYLANLYIGFCIDKQMKTEVRIDK